MRIWLRHLCSCSPWATSWPESIHLGAMFWIFSFVNISQSPWLHPSERAAFCLKAAVIAFRVVNDCITNSVMAFRVCQL